MAHITKRGGRWQATYRGPDQKERTKTFDRKVDAAKWIATQTADLARGEWIDARAGGVTLHDYALHWLEQRADLRSTTRSKYFYLLERHILPVLGSTTMAGLSPVQVRKWNADLARQHPSTAVGAYRLLSTICRTAVDDESIGRTPCRVKGAATERSPERPVATLADIDAAIEACPEKYRLGVLLATWCQLRRGEVLGLQRGDVDLTEGTVSVRRAWTMQSDGVATLGPPKTSAGTRTVAVPPNVLPVLADHVARFAGAGPEAWLFPGAGGHPASPRTLDRAWNIARTAAGREDLRFHDLRHTGLTWAAATGASAAELMRRGGHASPAAALRYQHATNDRDRVLADALGDLASAAKVTRISRTNRGQRPEDASAATADMRAELVQSEQSQRGSNPCLHLERASRPVQGVHLIGCSPGQTGWPSISSVSVFPEFVEFSSRASSKVQIDSCHHAPDGATHLPRSRCSAAASTESDWSPHRPAKF